MKQSMCIGVVAALALSGTAMAQTWNEVGDAGGATGVGGAQMTTGAGALQFINGLLDNNNDMDLYCINITDEALFQAQITGGSVGDTMLMLFNTDGTLQVWNDDFGSLWSTITSQGVFANGTYILGISSYVNAPLDAGNSFVSDFNLWPGPDAQQWSGNGTVLDHWSNDGFGFGDYQITLRGSEFCQVPAPGIAGLLGVGGLVTLRRRR